MSNYRIIEFLMKVTMNYTECEELAKEFVDAKALATRLEKRLKQAEKQSKPVVLYVVLVTLILFLLSN